MVTVSIHTLSHTSHSEESFRMHVYFILIFHTGCFNWDRFTVLLFLTSNSEDGSLLILSVQFICYDQPALFIPKCTLLSPGVIFSYTSGAAGVMSMFRDYNVLKKKEKKRKNKPNLMWRLVKATESGSSCVSVTSMQYVCGSPFPAQHPPDFINELSFVKK